MPLRLRTSTVRRGSKVYRYYQIARAVRRNGKPTHEIVAHLGRLEDTEAQAIREALRAAAPDDTDAAVVEQLVRWRDVECRASLRYLDLAVVHRIWQEWGLREFFDAYIPQGNAAMAPADVVEILVANRCVAPCSKLRVVEWAPRTALPEMLDYVPQRLHNTRIHRVLDGLEGVEPALTRFLLAHPLRKEAESTADAVVYLDLTSTWFEGRGGSLADSGRLKSGLVHRRVIQIALGVDANGLPIRWDLLSGRTYEGNVLPQWAREMAGHEELAGTPLVFDRGLASEDNLLELLGLGRPFVTCARRPNVAEWAPGIDFESIASAAQDAQLPAEVVDNVGWTPDPDEEGLFYVDFGTRICPGMEAIPAPGLRVVLFFRRDLYALQRRTVANTRATVERELAELNTELRGAKRHRKETATRKKADAILAKRTLLYDYDVVIEPIEVQGKRQPIRTFRVHFELRPSAIARREFSTGWNVLLASPDDKRTPAQLIHAYDKKEAVEHAFLLIKSVIDLRPFQHQTDLKIQAHVTLCILALLVDRAIELRLQKAGISMSIERVYEHLEPARLGVIGTRNGKFSKLSIPAPTPQQAKLLAALGAEDLASRTATKDLSRCRY